ncbi:5-aminolevulic acid synthase [Cognatishimia sp. MH4019]|uniref:5-aminolevulic acid synthase n=1 Tax=Cognatishimia sp. MH4019 TaxID=2854030 RepID=UPI001CD1EF12|nr:5-aminolevulic acid synthase [Cognatishimia sp. MH4019]
MKRAYLAGALALIAGAALAAPLTGKDARKALFKPGPVEIVVLDLPFLSAEDKAVLGQIAQQQKYYGAIAFAPEDGLLSESLTGAFNFHDVTAARAAAIKGCKAQRTSDNACEVVAELRPKGWEGGRALSLSGDATEAFGSEYRKAKSPKAMAVSPSTGLFAVATDPAAPGTATSQCEVLAQAGDCTVVLSE